MAVRGAFRLGGYVPTTAGYYAARLDLTSGELRTASARLSATTLWSGRHDEGEEGLQRALLHPVNIPVLRMLVDQPTAELEWSVGGIEACGDVDVAVVLRDPTTGARTLLMVDCDPAGATKPSRLRAQYVQALRGSHAMLSHLTFGDPQPEPRLVLLSPWRAGMALPRADHRPGWQRTRVDRPLWWGYVPFCIDGAEHVWLGRWLALDAERWLARLERRNQEWLHTEAPKLAPPDRRMRSIEYRVDLGQGSALVFLLDRGPFRARLRVPATKHKRAMLPPSKEDFHVHRIRKIREAAYGRSWAPTGWEFLGETIEKGCPWLTWRWLESDGSERIDWVTATDEAETFTINMKMLIY